MAIKYMKIKEFAEIISGSTPKTAIEEYWNGELNWITPAEVNGKDKYIEFSKRKLTEEGVKSCSLKLLPKGTVILTSRAPIGKVAIAKADIYCNQGFKNLICNKEIIKEEYIYYWLKSNNEYLNSLGRGATFKEISKKIVEEIQVPIIELEHQAKVVNILDKAQELIDKRKKQIEALDELVKSKFIEMFGDLYLNQKGWKQKRLGEVLTIERGGSPRPINEFITEDKSGINWIKIGDTNLDSMYITQTKEKIKPEGMKKSRYVEVGDLLLSNSMSFGRPYILKVNGCIHDGWLVLRDEKDLFNKIFLCVALGSDSTYIQFKRMAVGGVVNNLNKEMVKSLKFVIPAIELQNQFADFVKQVDKLKFNMEQGLKELEDNFNSLMQKAFKGELFNNELGPKVHRTNLGEVQEIKVK